RRQQAGALDAYYQVLALDPDHIEVKMLIARLHLEQGDAKLAAPLLRSVIESGEQADAQRAGAQWLLGQCYRREGRWPDAAQALAVGISSRRGSPRDWYELAEASFRAGDVRGAETAVGHVLRQAPSDLQALALRAALDEQARSAGLPAGYLATQTAHVATPAPSAPLEK